MELFSRFYFCIPLVSPGSAAAQTLCWHHQRSTTQETKEADAKERRSPERETRCRKPEEGPDCCHHVSFHFSLTDYYHQSLKVSFSLILLDTHTKKSACHYEATHRKVNIILNQCHTIANRLLSSSVSLCLVWTKCIWCWQSSAAATTSVLNLSSSITPSPPQSFFFPTWRSASLSRLRWGMRPWSDLPYLCNKSWGWHRFSLK